MHSVKPVIGITCGDLNGIGTELIIKTFGDNRLMEQCTPVVFSSNKLINFYKKSVPEPSLNYQQIRDLTNPNTRQLNVLNCWEEEVIINPGQLNEIGGKYAVKSLLAATQALKEKKIHGLVTAPIHKKNVQSAEFSYSGHTPFLKNFFGANDVVMMLCAGAFRVALVTEHLPVNEVAKHITKEAILSKLQILHTSLQKDFGIDKPRIAVLGLNPHAGDEGLVGTEEETVIRPAIKEAKNNTILAVGPYSADAFFARRQFEQFDAILAMYHDQGLIPFKSLAADDGINFTAGLPEVRTSPDHGVAFDIAGKNKADASSFLKAVFECIDIINQRKFYAENRKNPMKKITRSLLANAVDEKIEEPDEK
jgi:4-hydroxythreonine-4-phosphate dehydrogenase